MPKGGQQDRRAALRSAADDALSDLVSRPLPVADLLRVLRDGGHGRHVAAWSSRPEEQAALMRAGVAGSADPQGDDLALVAVNQFSIAKLDYYVRRAVDVDVEVGRERALVRQRVTFSLEMPTDLSAYVTGKYDRRLVGLADIAVAADADVAAVRRDDVAVEHTLLTDTGSQRVELHLDLADGTSTTYEVAYSVPVRDGRYALRLLPQPLAHDAQLRLAVRPSRGLELEGGPVRYDGPFDSSRRVEVRLSTPRSWPWS